MRTLPILLVILLASAGSWSALAQGPNQDAHERLVVTGRNDMHPYLGRGPEGAAHGAYADFWRLWGRRAGADLDFRLAPGDAPLQMLRDGRADCMLTAIPMGLEVPGLHYSEPFDYLEARLFYGEGLPGINGSQDLAGLRVGVVTGDPVSLFLMHAAPFGAVFVPFDDMDSLIVAADSGDVQAFAAFQRVGAYHLARLGVSGRFQYAREPLARLPVRAAVMAGRKDLMARIDQGLAAMSPDTLTAIKDKWHGSRLPSAFPWRWLHWGLVMLVLTAALVLVWTWQLRQRVRVATNELLAANKALHRQVAERRRAEANLAAVNQRLERIVDERTRDLVNKARQLEEANIRLLELDEMKSMFLSSVSHELRTPLTSMMGFAKLIARDLSRRIEPALPDDPDLKARQERIHDNLSIIVNEGQRLTRLVNDVLDLDKIESGRVAWNDDDLHPGELLEQAARSARGCFEDTAVTMEVDIQPNLPAMRLDRDKMNQLLSNLLSNAAKFTDAGTVRLSAWARNGHLRLRVDDTGRGIPRQDLERIFDKFHQARRRDTLEPKDKGTGLGLAICRHIVEHYGGRIWAESVVGLGSSFHVALPVHRHLEE